MKLEISKGWSPDGKRYYDVRLNGAYVVFQYDDPWPYEELVKVFPIFADVLANYNFLDPHTEWEPGKPEPKISVDLILSSHGLVDNG